MAKLSVCSGRGRGLFEGQRDAERVAEAPVRRTGIAPPSRHSQATLSRRGQVAAQRPLQWWSLYPVKQ